MPTPFKPLPGGGPHRPSPFSLPSPRLLSTLVLTLALGSCAWGEDPCPLPPLDPPFARGTLALEDSTEVEVEIAQTQAQRERGLMCRTQLAENQGMLLSYPNPGELGIWMKNMRLSLDILFLDGYGRILSIEASVPPCTASPCPIYRSSAMARHALELKAGAAGALGLRPGQRLRLTSMQK